MKKAVIATGGKQYLVSEGETLDIELVKDQKTLKFEPMLVISDKDTTVGKPFVSGATVSAEVIEPVVKAEKVIAIRYKAKKRVKKIQGHRQALSRIKITKIAAK